MRAGPAWLLEATGQGRRRSRDELTRLSRLRFGEQVDRTRTATDGAFALRPPGAGTYTLVCAPQQADGSTDRPRAALLNLSGEPVTCDIVLNTATTTPG